MPYKKYKNNYGWCTIPFDNSPLGYCYGYATMVDKKASKEEIKKMCSKKVEEISEASRGIGLKTGDYWCEFYKESEKK